MTVFDLLSDSLIMTVCVASAIGCFLVNRRIRRLESTEIGIGKAIAEMSRSLARLQDALIAAERAACDASARLDARIGQARALAAQLEAAGATGSTARPARSAGRTAILDGDPLADIVPRGLAPNAAPATAITGKPDAGPDGHALARLVLEARAASRPRLRSSPGGPAAA
jgi:hypothetical protein